MPDYNGRPPHRTASLRSRFLLFWIALLVVLGFSISRELSNLFLSLPASQNDSLLKTPFLTVKELKSHIQCLSSGKKKEVDLIARTVFGESRGENSFAALQAIAHVILNRTKDKKNWPSTVEKVILQKDQFSCWNQQDPNYSVAQSATLDDPFFREAYRATLVALSSNKDITCGANHYHACWVSPLWAQQKNMKRVAQIRQHIFYKASY